MKGLTPLPQVTRNQTSFLTRLIRRLEASAHGQYTENSRMTPRIFSQTLQTLRLTLELMLNGQQWHKTSPQRSSDDFYATPRPKGRTIAYTRTLGQEKQSRGGPGRPPLPSPAQVRKAPTAPMRKMPTKTHQYPHPRRMLQHLTTAHSPASQHLQTPGRALEEKQRRKVAYPLHGPRHWPGTRLRHTTQGRTRTHISPDP